MPTADVKQYDLSDFHQEMVRECFRPDTTVEQAMAVFTVLHSCKLRLRYPAIRRHPALLVLDPITTRHCAEVLATVWRDVPGSQFTDGYFYWYWNAEWDGYARLQEVSPGDAALAVLVKRTLESHPAVAEVIPDDWNPFVSKSATLS